METFGLEPVIRRRNSVVVDVGGVKIGGLHPIVIQSMTNTDTADVEATVRQIMLLADAGSELVRITVNNEAAARAVPRIELVRITVNNEAAARAVPRIVERLDALGYSTPIVGDFH